MSSHDDPADAGCPTRREDWPQFAIECVIERADDGADHCTVHPRDASSEELLDTWISAREGSFVSLAKTR